MNRTHRQGGEQEEPAHAVPVFSWMPPDRRADSSNRATFAPKVLDDVLQRWRQLLLWKMSMKSSPPTWPAASRAFLNAWWPGAPPAGSSGHRASSRKWSLKGLKWFRWHSRPRTGAVVQQAPYVQADGAVPART